MRKVWPMAALVVLSAAILLPTVGCNKPDDGLTQEQHQEAARLDEIAKKADGNWDRISPADREYVMKNFTSGDENADRMLMLAKAGKLRGTPGGPPHK